MPKNIFITGGAGFIDKLTYAGNLESLTTVADTSRYRFAHADICNRAAMEALFAEYQSAGIIHLAAESRVDRSIHGPGDFVQTNITGAFTLLEAARGYWSGLFVDAKSRFRFHHVSTDEVYGSLGDTGLFTETTLNQPNSPYSASKAALSTPTNFVCFLTKYFVPQLTANSHPFSGIQL